MEVVPDNETFRFGPGAVKKSSRAVIFLVAVGQNVFLLRASLLDRGGSFVDQYESGEASVSVIGVAGEDNRISKLPKRPGPLEVVAGHLTMDLKPKHASALQQQLSPQMWEQARQRQEATILRPSLEKAGLDSYHRSHIRLP